MEHASSEVVSQPPSSPSPSEVESKPDAAEHPPPAPRLLQHPWTRARTMYLSSALSHAQFTFSPRRDLSAEEPEDAVLVENDEEAEDSRSRSESESERDARRSFRGRRDLFLIFFVGHYEAHRVHYHIRRVTQHVFLVSTYFRVLSSECRTRAYPKANEKQSAEMGRADHEHQIKCNENGDNCLSGNGATYAGQLTVVTAA